MKHNKFLIAFMWKKQEILKKNNINLPYMDKQIEDVIMRWYEIEAKSIYEKIVNNIKNLDTKNLYCDTCPFCVKYHIYKQHYDCCKCEYGKIKGICGDVIFNIYEEIQNRLKNTEDVIFSNRVYRGILEEIEGKIK